VAIALLGLVAAAVAAAPALAAGHAVAIRDASFGPSSITIRAGDSITWTNRGTNNHNVTFDSFASAEQMEPGTKYSHTFRSAGTFRYTCTLHGFTGKVVVTGAPLKPTPKPTPKPTAQATTAPSVSPVSAASGPSPAESVPTPALGAVAPSPSASAVTAGGADEGASPARSTGPALVLVVGLVAAGAVGVRLLVHRRR
jgi:plastocyanin